MFSTTAGAGIFEYLRAKESGFGPRRFSSEAVEVVVPTGSLVEHLAYHRGQQGTSHADAPPTSPSRLEFILKVAHRATKYMCIDTEG